MPYATGAYVNFSNLPVPATSDLSSSRRIDFARGDYVRNAQGGFAPMDDVTQRVVLLCAFAIKRRKFVTPSALSGAKDDIRKALAVLTEGSEPTIKLIDVTVQSTSAGRVAGSVTFKNLRANTKQTVSI